MLETIIDFDPLDHAVWEDPHPLYRQLPKGAPIFHRERRDFWAIIRHADMRAGRLDWEHLSSNARTYVSLWRPDRSGGSTNHRIETSVELAEDGV